MLIDTVVRETTIKVDVDIVPVGTNHDHHEG